MATVSFFDQPRRCDHSSRCSRVTAAALLAHHRSFRAFWQSWQDGSYRVEISGYTLSDNARVDSRAMTNRGLAACLGLLQIAVDEPFAVLDQGPVAFPSTVSVWAGLRRGWAFFGHNPV